MSGVDAGKKPIRHDVRSVDVIQVILVRNLRGAGTESDPLRIVETYWMMDGTRLLEHDVEDENG